VLDHRLDYLVNWEDEFDPVSAWVLVGLVDADEDLYYLLIAPIDINAAKKRSSEPDMQGSFNELVRNLLGDGSQKLNDFLLDGVGLKL
jgi:hypothetical protein